MNVKNNELKKEATTTIVWHNNILGNKPEEEGAYIVCLGNGYSLMRYCKKGTILSSRKTNNIGIKECYMASEDGFYDTLSSNGNYYKFDFSKVLAWTKLPNSRDDVLNLFIIMEDKSDE